MQSHSRCPGLLYRLISRLLREFRLFILFYIAALTIVLPDDCCLVCSTRSFEMLSQQQQRRRNPELLSSVKLSSNVGIRADDDVIAQTDWTSISFTKLCSS